MSCIQYMFPWQLTSNFEIQIESLSVLLLGLYSDGFIFSVNPSFDVGFRPACGRVCSRERSCHVCLCESNLKKLNFHLSGNFINLLSCNSGSCWCSRCFYPWRRCCRRSARQYIRTLGLKMCNFNRLSNSTMSISKIRLKKQWFCHK